MTHSQEPWIVQGDGDRLRIVSGDKIILWMTEGAIHGGQREDAERIVACVNALRGVPTKELLRVDFKRGSHVCGVDPAVLALPLNPTHKTLEALAVLFREAGWTVEEPKQPEKPWVILLVGGPENGKVIELQETGNCIEKRVSSNVSGSFEPHIYAYVYLDEKTKSGLATWAGTRP